MYTVYTFRTGSYQLHTHLDHLVRLHAFMGCRLFDTCFLNDSWLDSLRALLPQEYGVCIFMWFWDVFGQTRFGSSASDAFPSKRQSLTAIYVASPVSEWRFALARFRKIPHFFAARRVFKTRAMSGHLYILLVVQFHLHFETALGETHAFTFQATLATSLFACLGHTWLRVKAMYQTL